MSGLGGGRLGGVVILGLAALGAATGVAAGVATTDGDRVVSASITPVAYSLCPAAGEIGRFHRGDRVLTTARNTAGDWFQVRDPSDLTKRVWVEAQYVVPDASTSGVPVAECDAAIAPAVTTPEDTSTPETTVPDETPTSTTAPSSTTTVRGVTTTTGRATTTSTPGATTPGSTTTAPTTTAPAATTTAAPTTTAPPADTTPPTVSGVAVQPDPPDACNKTSVSAQVTDNVGVGSVLAQWTYDGTKHTTTMTFSGGTTYSATLSNALGGNGGPLSITVVARDTAGNSGTASTSTTVGVC